MEFSLRKALSSLFVGGLGVFVTLIFIHPSMAQTRVSRPKTINQLPPIVREIPGTKYSDSVYAKKRMHVQTLDFSPSDRSMELKHAKRTLRASCSAFISLSPDDLDAFDSLADPEFQLYDSLSGTTYTLLTTPPPTPNHNAGTYSLDPFGRQCFWFESSNKTNRVMLAFDGKSRTIKAMLAQVYRTSSTGQLEITGEEAGVFALRVEIRYHARKQVYFADTVFRLYSYNETKASDTLETQTRHMFYRPHY